MNRGMDPSNWTLILLALWFVPFSGLCHAGSLLSSSPARGSISLLQTDAAVQAVELQTRRGSPGPEEPMKTIADPLEPVNRLSFYVNDRLYFLVLKPVASGYKIIVPQPSRVAVRNFFSNLTTPIRVASCLLQFKFKPAGTETMRFFVNTTLGLAGFVDTAKKEFNIKKKEEDFGQTLGFYGVGPVFYINWPILGPSSLRDTVGFVADFFLNPWNYLLRFPILVNIAVGAYDRINQTSLTLGTYEALKRAALDPYIAMRDAYHQYRQNKIAQ